MAERCSMCEEWADVNPGGVCDQCETFLDDLDAELEQIEAADPNLAELGRKVTAAWNALQRCDRCQHTHDAAGPCMTPSPSSSASSATQRGPASKASPP